MAMSETSEPRSSSEPATAPPKNPPPATVSASTTGAAPGWLFPLYVTGLVIVFIGERVLSGLEKGSGFVTAIGVLCVLAATVLRFAPRFRAGGERKVIESLLAVLSVIGVLALGVYFVTTDTGQAKFGIDKLVTEKREGVIGLLMVIWVSLITLSVVPMLFAETALRPMRRAERPESRRVKAAAIAGLSLVLAAIYGGLFVYATDGFGVKADYSYFKTSRPSESTRKIAGSLTEAVKVTAFFPHVNEVRNEVQSYLRELSAGNSKLQVQVQDRLLAPKLARDLRVNQDGVIAITKGSVTQTIVIGTELEQARPKLKTLDRDFQEQLLKVVRSRRTAYLTVGHGELNDGARAGAGRGRSADIVRTLLTKQNITVKDLGLTQGLGNEVPDDADLVLVLGPTEALSPEEISSLDRYATRGGRLLMAIDADTASTRDLLGETMPPGTEAGAQEKKPETKPAAKKPEEGKKPEEAKKPEETQPAAPEAPATPSFRDALAKIVGLSFSPDVLANDRQHVRVAFNDSDRTRIISGSFSSHASVSTLSRNAPRAAIVAFGASSLERAPGATGTIDFTVRSPGSTYRDKNRNFQQDKDGESGGVFNMAAAISRPLGGGAPPAKKDEKSTAKELRAFVTADADTFSDLVMSNVIGNQVLFVDAVRWLIGEESFSGPTNTEEDVRIEHTKQQDLAWFYAMIFGAPGLVLGVGLLVSRRSRRAGGKK